MMYGFYGDMMGFQTSIVSLLFRLVILVDAILLGMWLWNHKERG